VHPLVEFPFGPSVIRKFRLGNGLTIIVWEDHQSPVAAYQTWFAVGSGHERPGKSGMAHLFEHLMFKETTNHAEGEFDRMLEAQGVSTNAATWVDWTYYKESLPADKLPLVIELEADRMANMVLNQRQLACERDVVKNERRLRVDNDPDGKASEILYHKHFGSHPYGHPTIGWMEDIDAITLDDCLDFHRRYYAPDNAVVVCCGDVDTSELLRLVETHYGAIPPSESSTGRAAPEGIPTMLAVNGGHAGHDAMLPQAAGAAAILPRPSGYDGQVDLPPSHDASAGLRRPSAFAGRFGGTSLTIDQERGPERSRLEVLHLPVATPRVQLLATAPRLAEDGAAACRYLGEILFNSESARVRKLLVEDEELAVDVGGFYDGLRLSGIFEMHIALVPGADWKRAVQRLDEQIDLMVRRGCPDREREKGFNRGEIAFLRSALGAGSRARSLGHFETTAGDFRAYFAARDRMAAVTGEEVRAAAAQVLDPRQRTVVVTLPQDEEEGEE
jgi:predicted Zn-dependent peptidase